MDLIFKTRPRELSHESRTRLAPLEEAVTGALSCLDSERFSQNDRPLATFLEEPVLRENHNNHVSERVCGCGGKIGAY